MLSKRFLLFLIVLIIQYLKDYLIIASIYIQIFSMIFVLVLYFVHKKFILFCKDKLNKIEKKNKEQQNNNAIKILVKKRINIYSTSPFLEACKRGDTRLIQQLINSGVNIFETDENGDTAIHNAVYYLINNPEERNVSFLWTLHNAGCPINLKNIDGFTPLHIAAAFGHVSLIKWLIRKGADIHIKPIPFVIALEQGHKQAASILLPTKCNLTVWKNHKTRI